MFKKSKQLINMKLRTGACILKMHKNILYLCILCLVLKLPVQNYYCC